MVKVEETTQGVLDKISEGFAQKGAFNLRQNGISICHGDSEHIKIKKKRTSQESIFSLTGRQRERRFSSR